MLEVELVGRGDRAVIAGLRRRAGEGAGMPVERGRGGGDGAEAPGAGLVRHEADAVGRAAVIEAGDADGAVAVGEVCVEDDVFEGVAGGWAFKGELEEAPLFRIGSG